jgi:hydroxyacylglutathione hydrolase
LEDQPEPQSILRWWKNLNKVDRPLLTEVPKLKKLDYADSSALDKEDKLVDARDKTESLKALSLGIIQGNNSFATWAGWFLSYDRNLSYCDESKCLTENWWNWIGQCLRLYPVDKNMGRKKWLFGNSESNHNWRFYFATRGHPSCRPSLLPNITGHIKGADNVFVGSLPT